MTRHHMRRLSTFIVYAVVFWTCLYRAEVVIGDVAERITKLGYSGSSSDDKVRISRCSKNIDNRVPQSADIVFGYRARDRLKGAPRPKTDMALGGFLESGTSPSILEWVDSNFREIANISCCQSLSRAIPCIVNRNHEPEGLFPGGCFEIKRRVEKMDCGTLVQIELIYSGVRLATGLPGAFLRRDVGLLTAVEREESHNGAGESTGGSDASRDATPDPMTLLLSAVLLLFGVPAWYLGWNRGPDWLFIVGWCTCAAGMIAPIMWIVAHIAPALLGLG